MSAAPAPRASPAKELGRFLEIQNLGLNLSFALAFLLLAADGLPSLRTVVLVVIAFVAARNAGHSFNRWADREIDARNPRTKGRLVASGRASPVFALAFCAANAALLVGAAYFLNPLAFVLAPVALAIVLGYSYTKRVTSFTTAFLGLVEAITPAAVFIAVRGTLPLPVLLAVGGLLAWGTAFETVHSLGDIASDRELGLYSVPVRIGPARAARLVPVLHAVALGLLALFGLAIGLPPAYFGALVVMGGIAAVSDRALIRSPTETRMPFNRHFALGAIYLLGVVLALFYPLGPVWMVHGLL
ncbi:MAG: 4-hydroxybenzoate octaprenyltransferase [Thermoplasmata archaeon]|nr:4-hydroxybenzoate octaprenyltransferase [Thermoplasmata archaeon]